MAMQLSVNGKSVSVNAEADTPLLWVIRDELGMTGTKFGCGMALCGACTVHLDGKPVRSCSTPLSAAAGKKITTIEAIGATTRGQTRAAGLAAARRAAVRLLPVGPDHERGRAAARQTEPDRRRHRRRDGGQHLPLRHLPAHPRGHPQRCRHEGSLNMSATQESFAAVTFLKTGAAAGGGLMIGVVLPGCATPRRNARRDRDAQCLGAHRQRQQRHHPVRPLRNGPGRVTAMPMLVAEELEVDCARSRSRSRLPVRRTSTRCSAARSPAARPRCAMAGTSCASPARRRASMLVKRGRSKWSVDAAAARRQNGVVTARRQEGELRRAGRGRVQADAAQGSRRSRPEDFRYVGKRMKRLDTPAKVNGTAEFGIDVKLPGMLYAALAQCPVLGGKVVELRRCQGEGHARREARGADHRRCCRGGRQLVAARKTALRRDRDQVGRRTVRAPRFSGDRRPSSRAPLSQARGSELQAGGDADAAHERVRRRRSKASYEMPFTAHATLEPMNFTADVRKRLVRC